METAIVMPLNSFAAAKSRLQGSVPRPDREALVRWMAERVLGAVRDAGLADAAAVVSPDDDVLAWVASHGYTPLRQVWGDLNEGLDVGRRWALERGADALLVLLGDLPYLTSHDVTALVAMSRTRCAAPQVVLAPDRHGRGTNAMLLRPPAALPFAFGVDSRARHLALARRLSLVVDVYRSMGTSRDVDTPDDVRELAASGLWRPGSDVDVGASAPAGWGAAQP